MEPPEYIQFSITNCPETVDDYLEAIEIEAVWRDDLSTLTGIIKQEHQNLVVRAVKITHPDLKIQFSAVELTDWLEKEQNVLPPLHIPPFYIYGPRHADPIPKNKIPICLDSPAAFGSGHHPTTRGCIEAMARLASESQINTVLDIGCGSGLLSIVAASVWKCKTIAFDCDQQAVQATLENCKNNNISSVQAFESSTLEHKFVEANAPYDLILANIHLNTISSFAPQTVSLLSKNGRIVLSGILESQAATLTEIYRKLLAKKPIVTIINDWAVVQI